MTKTEELMALADVVDNYYRSPAFQDLQQAATAAERERAAKIGERFPITGKLIAASIRGTK